jgi:hypothetical protein
LKKLSARFVKWRNLYLCLRICQCREHVCHYPHQSCPPLSRWIRIPTSKMCNRLSSAVWEDKGGPRPLPLVPH